MTTENKKLTLADLIAKKSDKQAEKNRVEPFLVASLGGEVEVSNPGSSAVYKVLDMPSDTTSDAMYANATLVYQAVKLFQSPELHEEYEVLDPIDIVLILLTPAEIKLAAQTVMEIAGFASPEEMSNNVKN